jgi:hypothetical protein
MVLLCITGELGTGKTLALTYLAYRNYLEGQKIYANYLLYGIPFYYVRTIPQLEQMQDGFFAGDELWSWTDARCPLKKRTQIVNRIILRSRKENLTIAYTAQSFSQIDMRVRNITDYLCLHPDEEVFCSNGFKKISEIKVGEKVLTSSGFKEVINTGKHFENSHLYKITPQYIQIPILMNAEHPILVSSPSFSNFHKRPVIWNDKFLEIALKNFFAPPKILAELLGKSLNSVWSFRGHLKRNYLQHNIVWKRANELNVYGDLIALPIITEEFDLPFLKISDYAKHTKEKMRKSDNETKWVLNDGYWKLGSKEISDKLILDKNFLKLCGYYIADGDNEYPRSGNISIGLNLKTEEEKVEEIKELFENLNIKPKVKKKEKMNEVFVRINCTPLAILFTKLFGKYSINKRIPFEFLTLPKEKQKFLLESWIKGDGYELKSCNYWYASTSSKTLAFQLIHLISRLGKRIAIRKYPVPLSIYPAYHIWASSRGYFYKNYFLSPIKSIEKIPYNGFVYNIEVDEVHNYMNFNVLSHNSYPLMSVDNTWTKLIILSNTGKRIAPPMYFDNEPIFAMYNTNEKIEVPEEEDTEELTETFIPIVKNPAWVRYLLKKGITNTDDIIEYSERLQKEIEKRRNLAKIQQKLSFEELVRKTISDIEIKYDGYLKNSRAKENLRRSI